MTSMASALAVDASLAVWAHRYSSTSSVDSRFILSIVSRQTVVHCTSKVIPLENNTIHADFWRGLFCEALSCKADHAQSNLLLTYN